MNLGHLADVIYTRDVWMHTIDMTRAVGRPVNVTDRVNRRIVSDVVAEWVSRHGQSVELTLTGPAGGRYCTGIVAASDPIDYDAVEFCRVLSGRAAGQGLMATRVVFYETDLRSALVCGLPEETVAPLHDVQRQNRRERACLRSRGSTQTRTYVHASPGKSADENRRSR